MSIGSKRMSALYRGKGKTRAIPRDVWTDDSRELARTVVQTRPREAGQFAVRNKVNAPQLSGKKSRGSIGGTGFAPAQSNAKFR